MRLIPPEFVESAKKNFSLMSEEDQRRIRNVVAQAQASVKRLEESARVDYLDLLKTVR